MGKRLILALLIIFSFVGVALSQDNIGTSLINESDALDTAKKWAELVGQANVAELEKLLNEKYVHTHATALVESKTEFLTAFKNGTRKYDPINLEDLTAAGFGSFAIIRGKFPLKAFTRGKTIEGINRFSLVITKTQKGFEVVSFQATPIPKQ